MSATGPADKIDIHAHYYDDAYLEFLEERGVDTALGRRTLGGRAGLDERFAMMADAGIRLQVLSSAPLLPVFDDAQAAADGARLHNEALFALARAHDDRFAVFAALPFPFVDESMRELERVGPHGPAGYAFPISAGGASIASDAYLPVMRELDRRGATVFVHPTGVASGFYRSSFDLTWLVGAVFEDTSLVADVLTSGWTARLPGLRLVVPHLGGAAPFILRRIDDQFLVRSPGYAGPAPSEHARSIWYDTVNSDPRSLALALAAYGARRVVLGTDFPYLPGPLFTQAAGYVREAGLPPEAVALVEHENAAALLGR